MDEIDPIEIQLIESYMAAGRCYFAALTRYRAERDYAKQMKQYHEYVACVTVSAGGSRSG